MIGAVFGDIIGSVFEWRNQKTEDIGLITSESRYTDDTVMLVAVADKLLEDKHGVYRRKGALQYAARYKAYYRRYPYAGYGQMFADWAMSASYYRQKSFGNGAAMRCCPIAYALNDLREIHREVRQSCLYTHNNREAISGAQAIASCVFMARKGADKDDIRRYVERQFGISLDFSLDEIRPSYSFSSRTRDTVPQAIVAFLESSSYESAIRKAISIGGDSDTIASMAGGIAHAYYSHIPKALYEQCLPLIDSGLKNTLLSFCSEFHVTW